MQAYVGKLSGSDYVAVRSDIKFLTCVKNLSANVSLNRT